MPDMSPMNRCEYVLVEYAPSPLRETSVAVGLFLFDASARLVRQGFAADWRSVRCLDPQADIAMLSGLAEHFERIARPSAGGDASGEELYTQLRRMHDEVSGGLQISTPRGVLTTNPEQEFELLFQEHIERPPAVRQKQEPREGSRPWIHAELSAALRRHSLWEHLARDVPVSAFTAPGDGFRIDFSYRPNGVTHYLHAISLERDWNQAKLLGYTYWRIREQSAAQMTAIVADPLPSLAAAESCREILSGAQIAIQPLSSLDPYLEGVRREMGLV